MTGFQLRALSGNLRGGPVRLKDGENLVGRSRSADVGIDESDVSGRHCKITVAGGGSGPVAVEPISDRGTFLDDTVVEHQSVLFPGQIIRLGRRTRLVLEEADGREVSSVDSQPPVPGDQEEPTGMTRGTSLSSPSSAHEDPPSVGTNLGTAPGMEGTRKTAAFSEGSEMKFSPEEDDPTPSFRPSIDDEGTAPFSFNFDPQDPDGQTVAATPHSGLGVHSTDSTSDGDEVTRALETRAVARVDIEALREVERTRRGKRNFLLVVVGIALVIPLIFFLPQPELPEREFGWPRDAQGRYLNEEIEGLKPFEDGGYLIGIPGGLIRERENLPAGNGTRIVSMISRGLDVPLVIRLEEREDPFFLEVNLLESVEEWMQIHRDRNTGWEFGVPSEVSYLGSENGIPFVSIDYDHREGGSWHGVVRLFQYHGRLVELRTEVPYSERIRASRLLNLKYVIVSSEFERRHWGGGSFAPDDRGDSLAWARTELRRNAPAVWSSVEKVLVEICRAAKYRSDMLLLKEAEAALVDLRDKQRIWFNGQKIARERALLQDNRSEAQQIAEICKGVFSNPLDQRYGISRRQDWY